MMPKQGAAALPIKASMYEPKFNDKGELDFSGSWRAPSKEGSAAEGEAQTQQPQTSAAVSVSQPDVKKSVDLSGLTLEELKELQGHY